MSEEIIFCPLDGFIRVLWHLKLLATVEQVRQVLAEAA